MGSKSGRRRWIRCASPSPATATCKCAGGSMPERRLMIRVGNGAQKFAHGLEGSGGPVVIAQEGVTEPADRMNSLEGAEHGQRRVAPVNHHRTDHRMAGVQLQICRRLE